MKTEEIKKEELKDETTAEETAEKNVEDSAPEEPETKPEKGISVIKKNRKKIVITAVAGVATTIVVGIVKALCKGKNGNSGCDYIDAKPSEYRPVDIDASKVSEAVDE